MTGNKIFSIQLNPSEYEKWLFERLGELKCKDSSQKIQHLPLYAGDEEKGYLEAVTIQHQAIHPEYVPLLSLWRKENPEGFANIFEISDQRTLYWLDHVLLKRDDRVLFFIYSMEGKALGHIGLSSFDFNKRSCEIDNVVRGVKDDNKGIMAVALNTLIKWASDNLKVQDIYLRVLSDNEHARKFYLRNGFQVQFEIPLYKHSHEGEIRWIEEKCDENDLPDRFYTYMKYNKSLGEK